MGLLTTTIGAYPKPDYVNLPDWFDDLDTAKPTEGWSEALHDLGKDAESIIEKGTDVIDPATFTKVMDMVNENPAFRKILTDEDIRVLNGLENFVLGITSSLFSVFCSNKSRPTYLNSFPCKLLSNSQTFRAVTP